MNEHAWAERADAATQVRFDWRDFDGGECYGGCSLSIRRGAVERRFDWGRCATSFAVNVKRFLRDPGIGVTGHGFTCPEVRAFILARTGTCLHLLVVRDGTRFSNS